MDRDRQRSRSAQGGAQRATIERAGIAVRLVAGLAISLAALPLAAQSDANPPAAVRDLPVQALDRPIAASVSAATKAVQSTSEAARADAPICGLTHLGLCLRDYGADQKGIWTSPFRLQPKDAAWLMPLGAATGLAVAYDAEASAELGVDTNRANIANNIANFGSPYATATEGAGLYFLGLARKDPKLTETGRLGVEAILDAETVAAALKMATNRQRPLQGNGQGDFWAHGSSHWEFDSSFPSGHATGSMALARVVAGEYPHWYVAVPAYGFAETIGISRLLANEHFPSDVLVAQAIGFLSGGYVLRHHSLYSGKPKSLAGKIVDSLHPVADANARATGVAVEIPFGE